MLSIVIPVFNEEESLPHLQTRLDALIAKLEMPAEVWLVDDHSTDRTPELLRGICFTNDAYHFIRLAGNSGSHVAILAGLSQTVGECVAILAADLQDPPELIPQMLQKWREGNHVIWAVREQREGISITERFTANLFYWLLNRFSEVKLPPTGADFSLLDRAVVDALLQSVGANPSMGLEVARLGFRQVEIPYVKAARQFGRSKWNLRKKLNAFADAFVTTSYMPLRAMSYIGITVSVIGFLYALVIVTLRFFNVLTVEGWAALMVVVLVFGGVQMLMLGVIGEYLWRTLEHARQRPLYFVEESSEENT
ncbi:MAG: glycosyltransferase family 2 protein [Anaerolineae bacterium]|nr:glycosyltransferase family 2 protein [Anaerolineae bacterium]